MLLISFTFSACLFLKQLELTPLHVHEKALLVNISSLLFFLLKMCNVVIVFTAG